MKRGNQVARTKNSTHPSKSKLAFSSAGLVSSGLAFIAYDENVPLHTYTAGVVYGMRRIRPKLMAMGFPLQFPLVLILWATVTVEKYFCAFIKNNGSPNPTFVLSFSPVTTSHHKLLNDYNSNSVCCAIRGKWSSWGVDQRCFRPKVSRCSPAIMAAVGSTQQESDNSNANAIPQQTSDVSTKVTKPAIRSPKHITMPICKKTWQVWKTISRLEEILLEDDNGVRNGITVCNDDANNNEINSFALYPASRDLVAKILSILKTLAVMHEGKVEWQGLLNKSTLLHEVEESILAIHFLQQEWSNTNTNNQPCREIVLVDVCCGKGVFSLLSSYFFASNNKGTSNKNSGISIQKIIMLDKDPKLRWDHIHASNQESEIHGRPFIECWPRFNLHDIDDVVDRLEAETNTNDNTNTNSCRELAMVGIHLCKTLSPTCVGIANLLGPLNCPHLVLAPCCLPRVVVQSKYKTNSSDGKVLEVRQYETQTEREERSLAKQRRDQAMVRGKGGSANESSELEKNRALGACWKCGEFGHVKADCPSNQSTGKPRLIKPPTVSLKVSGILETDQPFGSYCELLSGSIQRKDIAVEETGLTNKHVATSKQTKKENKQEANNWNRDRKSMYIVATERVPLINLI